MEGEDQKPTTTPISEDQRIRPVYLPPEHGSVIPILRVESAKAAVEWYNHLGFIQAWEHRFEPHLPAFVEISNGAIKLFLSEHTGDATPNTLVYIRVPDVDAFVQALEGVVVEDVPWGRDCEVVDLDGNRLRIGTSNR